MTEREWRTCDDALKLLALAGRSISDRRRRLLLCAACRAVWHLMTDERSREAVETAERFADGRATAARLKWLRGEAGDAVEPLVREAAHQYDLDHGRGRHALRNARTAAFTAIAAAKAADVRVDEFRLRDSFDPEDRWSYDDYTMRAAFTRVLVGRAEVVRDILGNPFRTPSFESGDVPSTARALAEGIDADQAFERLPILADSLEESGRADEELLAHCRGPGPHVLGCWAVDWVLGRG